MKINKFLIACVFLLGLYATTAAQNSENSPEDDFNNYDRGLIQTPVAKSPNKPKRNGTAKTNYPPNKPAQSKRKPATSPKSKSPEPTQTAGLPGIKVWFERQNGCEGSFSAVAPTSVFTTGDCVRVRFETNFEGYLTIINLGTSGNKKTIFPANGSSGLIAARVENYLPDGKGWEFTGVAGNEQLFFIISNTPLDKKSSDNLNENRDLTADDSPAVEIYDRDLTPRSENESVYILADEKKLEKALIFRLTLKHR